MKTTFTLSITAAAALVAFLAVQAMAQQAAQTPAKPPEPAKIGVVDLGYVFSGFLKAKKTRNPFEKELLPLRAEEEKLKKLIMDWQSALSNPESKLTPAQVNQGEKAIKDCKRRLEELKVEWRERIEKCSESQLVRLFKEVADAVREYGTAHGYHMVFGYGEARGEDLLSSINVQRKLEAMDQGFSVLLRHTEWTDISQQVLERVNRIDASQ